MSTFTDFQMTELPQLEGAMTDFIVQHTGDQQLQKSMLYSITAGGKRIRPLLLLATVRSFQEPTAACYQVAAALEMVHTYSLIHDDLPAMDNDDLRRGKPTNHKVFGAAMATLAGDGLLTEAFERISATDLPAEKRIRLVSLLAQAAGTNGMVAGQAMDIQGEKKQLTLSQLQELHRKKTGALIRFAVVAGGVLADQSEAMLTQLDRFAQHLGLAFQIRDDLLDVVATTEQLGKKTHKDAVHGKNTYPVLLGIEPAYQALEEELASGRQVLHEAAADTTLLAAIVDQLVLERGTK